jgi:hypothetical protein
MGETLQELRVAQVPDPRALQELFQLPQHSANLLAAHPICTLGRVFSVLIVPSPDEMG